MIDIENEIFNTIAVAIRGKFSPVYIYGEYQNAPALFPVVTIEEKSNSAYERSQDSGSVENHAYLMYEVNVYSNKQAGRKSECKAIFAALDDEFATLGFTRTSKEPIPNLEDATIFRMVGRYTAVASANEKIYRR